MIDNELQTIEEIGIEAYEPDGRLLLAQQSPLFI
jgi:hypothetical protein